MSPPPLWAGGKGGLRVEPEVIDVSCLSITEPFWAASFVGGRYRVDIGHDSACAENAQFMSELYCGVLSCDTWRTSIDVWGWVVVGGPEGVEEVERESRKDVEAGRRSRVDTEEEWREDLCRRWNLFTIDRAEVTPATTPPGYEEVGFLTE